MKEQRCLILLKIRYKDGISSLSSIHGIYFLKNKLSKLISGYYIIHINHIKENYSVVNINNIDIDLHITGFKKVPNDRVIPVYFNLINSLHRSIEKGIII